MLVTYERIKTGLLKTIETRKFTVDCFSHMDPAVTLGVAVQPRRHVNSGGDRATPGSCCGGEGRQRRTSTREKIARMVAEGANNYPSYLKLIYTGDSEEPSSSEDELAGDRRITGSGGRGRGRGSAAGGDGGASVDKGSWQSADRRTAESLASSRQSATNKTGGRDALVTSLPGYHAPATDVITSVYDVYGDVDHTEEALRQRLIQVQAEIAALKAVLNSKVAQAATLRQNLGYGHADHWRSGLRNLTESETFQKTNAAFKSLGAYASRKMNNIRHSMSFRSVDETVGSLKTSQSMGSIRSRWGKSSLTSSKSENNVVGVSTNETSSYNVDDVDDQ